MFVDYYRSNTAQLESDKLLVDITTTFLDLRTWTKSTREFIMDLEEKFLDYNEGVRCEDQVLNDQMQKSFMQRAVNNVRDLREIKTREMEHCMRGGDPYDYATYRFMLHEAAKIFDSSRTSRSRKLAANSHSISDDSNEDGDGEFHDDDDGGYAQIDEISTALEVHYMGQRNPGSRMDKATWDKLSPEAQKVWDTMEPQYKALILNSAKRRADEAKSKQDSSNKTKNATRSANVHESVSDVDGESVDESKEDNSEDTTTLEANSATQTSNDLKGKAHPADPRRLLGGSKPKPALKVTHLSISQTGSSEEDDGTEEGDQGTNDSVYWGYCDEYWGDQEDQFFG